MPKNMYFNLLLLMCGILSQGFIETIADANIEESSDILVRQKRVISRLPCEDRKVPIIAAPYIVRVKYNIRINCIGSILSRHVAITIAVCVPHAPTEYIILSGASRTDGALSHNVTDITKHYGNHPHRAEDGVALLTVNRPFVFGQYTGHIELHSGLLLPGTLGTVLGWGYNVYTSDHGTEYPRNLRSINVPIMPHRDCVNKYRPHNIEISDMDICTFHQHKYCGHSDAGAPLIVHGYLVGIRLWAGPGRDQFNPQYPDVFVLLQHSAYYQWITSNVHNIEATLLNHHN